MTQSPLRLAFALTWRERADLIRSSVCHVGERVLLLSLPVLATSLVRDAGSRGSVPQSPVLWIALVMLAVAGLRYLGVYFGIRAQERAIRSLRRDLTRRVLRVPLPALQARRPGEIGALVGAHAEKLVQFAADTLRDVVPSVVTLGGAYAMLLVIDVWLGLAILPTIAFAVAGTRLLSRTTRPSAAAAFDHAARLDGIVEETIELVPALRAAGAESKQQDAHNAATDELLAARLTEQRAMSWFGALSLLLASLSLLLLVVVGTSRMTAGTLQPLDLVEALLFTMLMVSPLSSVADTFGGARKSRAISDRIAALLRGPLEDADVGDDVEATEGRVSLDGVCFAYPDHAPVLRDVTMTIEPRSLTALVGPNGAGKTTTLRLLVRMYAPDAGSIRIDGMDVARASLRSLRRAVALIPQRDYIAFGTIRDNIDFGPDPATDAQVEAAARRAGLHEFIANLPEGYDTFVASGGSTLSGGQRKRLILARALMHDPRVLLLDEPTAMLDDEARQQVLAILAALRGDTTVIVATHDPAVIAAVDHAVTL